MDSRKNFVEILKKNSQDARSKAKEFRTLAASQKTREEAALYLQQATEEEAKAKGYIRQAELLSELGL